MLDTIKSKIEDGTAQGYYEDIPEEIYHSKDFPGISASKLNLIRRSLNHYEHSFLTKIDTPALHFGRAFHCAILTPQIFDNDYVVEPKFDKRTKAGKEGAAEFAAQAKGKIILNHDDYKTIVNMRNECFSTSAVKYLLDGGMKELTMLWYDQEILCKGRTDLIRPDDCLIVDFKTTENASEKSFSKDIAKYYYDRSAAFYLDGASAIFKKEFKTFAYIVIEKNPPYDLGLYVLDQSTIETGKRIYKEDLQRYNDYNKSPDKNIFKSKEFSLVGMQEWAHRIGTR